MPTWKQANRAILILGLIASGLATAAGLVSAPGSPIAAGRPTAAVCFCVLLAGITNWRD